MPPEQNPLPPPEKPPFNFFETSTKKNFAPWFLKFLLVLVAIGIVITGLIWYQARHNYKAGLDALSKSEEQIQVLKQQRDQDSTADWQTYRNEEYGFELKIPADWMVDKVEETGLFADNLLFVSSTTKASTLKNEECLKVSIHCDYEHIDWDFKFSNKIKSTGDEVIAKVETVNINGLEFKIYPLGGLYTYFVFEVTKNSKIYSFTVRDKDEGLEILSTFKFIPSTPLGTSEPIPADWKTYRSEKYEYEFRYPSSWPYKHCDIGDNYLLFNAECNSDKPSSPNSSVIVLNNEVGTYNSVINMYKNSTFFPLVKEEQIKIDDKKASLFIIRLAEPNNDKVAKVIIFEHNNFFFKITIRDKDFETFNQILSSFKFTK